MFFRMPVESPESRTVEVRALPAAVDEELLFLYFENKRRSGGGPLVSVEKSGDRAVLVFEEAEGEWKTEDFCSGGGGEDFFANMCRNICGSDKL